MNIRVRLFAATVVIGVVSAYVNLHSNLIHRHLVRESRPSSHRHKLQKTNDDFFVEKRDPNNRIQGNPDARKRTPKNRMQSSQRRTQIIEQFCFEIGCKIHAYEKTTERLKRLKMELSNEMLAVEDEIHRRHYWLEFGNDLFSGLPSITELVALPPPTFPFSPSWWSSFPEALYNGNDNSQEKRKESNISNEVNGDSLLEERRSKLSDRALAIQNLLTTLHAMEQDSSPLVSPPPLGIDQTSVAPGAAAMSPSKGSTTPITTRTTTISTPTKRNELSDRYRRIVGAEGIDIFSGSEANKPTPKIPHHALETPRGGTFPFSDWKSLWTPWQQPQPPRQPPTTREFMVRWKRTQNFKTLCLVVSLYSTLHSHVRCKEQTHEIVIVLALFRLFLCSFKPHRTNVTSTPLVEL
jgi:hypothetical protein